MTEIARLPARPAEAPPRAVLPSVGEGGYEPIPGTLTFGEVLAALNPLHHLPVIGTIYRAATGETLQPALRILGAGLLGGPIGMLSTAAMAAIEEFRAAGAPAQAVAFRQAQARQGDPSVG
jgi:hypothetical protein